MDVVREQIEEAAEIGVDLAAQAVADALAHHRPLLARDGREVVLDLRQDRLAEGDVQILARPVGMAHLAMAQLEMLHAQPARGRIGRLLQSGRGLLVVRGHSPIHAERERHQGIAEQPALDPRERQHALDFSRTFGVEEEGAMPEDLLEERLPAGAVEEARLRAVHDEGIPARRIPRGELAHRDRARSVHGEACPGGVHGRVSGNTASTRPQRKSRSRRPMRACMRSRLR